MTDQAQIFQLVRQHARRRAGYVGLPDWEDLANEAAMIVLNDKRLNSMNAALLTSRIKEVVNREAAKLTKANRKAAGADTYTRRPARIAGYNDTEVLASGADAVHVHSPLRFIEDVLEGASYVGLDMEHCDDEVVQECWNQWGTTKRQRIYERLIDGVEHPRQSRERREANRAIAEFIDLVNAKCARAVSIDAITELGIDIRDSRYDYYDD